MDTTDDPTVLERQLVDQPDSLLEQLAAKREEISNKKETFIPIPGYDVDPPLLLAKYRLLEGPELAGIADKARRETKSRWDRGMTAGLDTILMACIGIFVDTGNGKPVPLTLNGQEITGFNDDLAVALKFNDKLPEGFVHRDVLYGLFGGNEVAIAEHNFRLNRWFGNTSIDVSQDLFGGNS